MVQPPKKPNQATSAAKHRSPRRQREERRQRLIIIVSGAAIGIALIAVLIGVFNDQVYVPGQAIAKVNGVSLSRSAYWKERRNDSAASISQALFLTAFGPQFAQQVQSQINGVDSSIPTIRTAPIDENVIGGWVDRQLVIQGARQFNIQVSNGEVAQLVDASFGPNFGPPPPPITGTMAITPTIGPTATLAPTLAPTVTPGGPTLTPAPTLTLAPTFTPAPTQVPTITPPADQALTRVDVIYKTLYDRYVNELSQIDPTRKAQLTIDDFKSGLADQFQRQVFAGKIEEQLVPDASFTPTTDPSAIETRHILIKVTVPLSATDQEREAAFTQRRPEIDAILKELRDGAKFEDVAKAKTEDYTTKEQGGTLAPFDKTGKTNTGSQIDPAIVQAVAPLKEGQISDVIRTSFGWHVVELVKRTVDPRETQLRAARTKAFDEWLTKQRAAATIERDPLVIPTPTTAPTATPAALPTVELNGLPSPTPLPTIATPGVVVTPPAATAQPTPTSGATATPAP
jgi:hypothetical protein